MGRGSRKPAAAAAQQPVQAPEPPAVATDAPEGIGAAQRRMQSGGFWPTLKTKNGDRVHFWFLTSGNDRWFNGAEFHLYGQFPTGKRIICLRALTDGNEECTYCDEGHTVLQNRFACWVWVDYILHLGNNPDEQGDEWTPVQIQVTDASGTLKARTVFQEMVEDVKLLEMPAGRRQVWFAQFTSAWTQAGDLQLSKYELHRVGEGRDDTDYTLSVLVKEAVPKEIAELAADQPAIADVFRQSLQMAGLGSDGLDSGGAQEAAQPGDALPSIPVAAGGDEGDSLV